MGVSRVVVNSLKRKGTANVMAFVGHARAKGKRKTPITLAHEDLSDCFLCDHRSVFEKYRCSNVGHNLSDATGQSHLRYFEKLGIVFGTVDRTSLDHMLTKLPVTHVTGPLGASLVRPIDSVYIGSPTRPIAWGLEAMRVPALWDAGLSGAGIAVGHLDTGVDGDHPTLRSAVSKFAFVDEQGEIDPTRTRPTDTEVHGTHTAATIAGSPVRGKRLGVAPGASLCAAAVIEGGLTQLRIIAGMEWALSHGVRILNVSLGIRGFVEDFHLLTRRMRDVGVLPVFAVGNEGVDSSRAPGNYDEALSVGASDPGLAVPAFSSSDEIAMGRTVPDLVAPGTAIESALAGGAYLSMSGTSMAAPHVSGLAALLLEARPEASVDVLESAIFASCRTAPTLPSDRAGLGMPQADVALAKIRA